jgi:hypothetical protein
MTGDRAVLRPLRGRLNDERVFSRRLAALEEAAPAFGYSGWAWLRTQDVCSEADIPPETSAVLSSVCPRTASRSGGLPAVGRPAPPDVAVVAEPLP